MKLHLDKDSFVDLIERTNREYGIRKDVLEKDYYVCLFLEELSNKQKAGLPAYFKGGTALYKSLKKMNRFSEDIDLSVNTEGCNRTQNDKRLAAATKKYVSLKRNIEECRTNGFEVLTVYDYDPLVTFAKEDRLERFGKVKIEATSFTIGEPTESILVTPLLYDFASETDKKILQGMFEVAPVPVQTISLERIYIDKLFAAEGYSRRDSKEMEFSKHIYDLVVMESLPRIQELYVSPEKMKGLLDLRMTEEQSWHGGVPGVCPCELTFFTTAGKTKAFRDAFELMQDIYVFNPKDRISLSTALASLSRQKQFLLSNAAWKKYRLEDIPERKEIAHSVGIVKDKNVSLKSKSPNQKFTGKER